MNIIFFLNKSLFSWTLFILEHIIPLLKSYPYLRIQVRCVSCAVIEKCIVEKFMVHCKAEKKQGLNI